MDEATAAIDRETDAAIQQMIRSKFEHCTVLCIAHRLHTIIDSTKVLVMDKGVAAEFASPNELLDKEGGLFAGLWAQHIAEGGNVLSQKSVRVPRGEGHELVSADELAELENEETKME